MMGTHRGKMIQHTPLCVLTQQELCEECTLLLIYCTVGQECDGKEQTAQSINSNLPL